MDADVAVVGAGAVGASAAMHLAETGHRVLVLEKEPGAGAHQSGRNSGVIHAGYNVEPGTQKARFCVEGNARMHAFCEGERVPVRRGGIAVVAQDEGEQAVLEELHRRAKANGVAADLLDTEGLQAVEPHVAGRAALHAPEASSVDARAYVAALEASARREGASFRFGSAVQGWSQDDEGVTVRTRAGAVRARALLNAAGLHADRIAQEICLDMRIVPFRGFYARLRPARTDLVRSHIYAAPDLQFPFLGLHLSKTTTGAVQVGPGAMLAFGREAYRFWGTRPRDLAGTLGWPGFWRMLADRRIRRLVRTEVDKSLRLRAIWKEARRLVPGLRADDLERGVPAGVRAQMVDRQGRLVDDIVVREQGRTVHVLNAVSPGLTCSLPFGEDLAGRVERVV